MHRKVLYNDLPTQSNISSELKLNMKYYSKYKFNVRGPIGLWVPQDYQLIFLQEVSRYSEDDIITLIYFCCVHILLVLWNPLLSMYLIMFSMNLWSITQYIHTFDYVWVSSAWWSHMSSSSIQLYNINIVYFEKNNKHFCVVQKYIVVVWSPSHSWIRLNSKGLLIN